MTRRSARSRGLHNEDTPEERTLTLHGFPVRVSGRGSIPAEDLKPVHAAAMAGRYPSPEEVEAFSTWTRGAVPIPRWDDLNVEISHTADRERAA